MSNYLQEQWFSLSWFACFKTLSRGWMEINLVCPIKLTWKIIIAGEQRLKVQALSNLSATMFVSVCYRVDNDIPHRSKHNFFRGPQAITTTNRYCNQIQRSRHKYWHTITTVTHYQITKSNIILLSLMILFNFWYLAIEYLHIILKEIWEAA